MILLTGSSGMIGHNIKDKIPRLLTPTHAELELTDAVAVKEYLRVNQPEMIIHAASNDDEICLKENMQMFLNLAESGIKMITFCTGLEVENRNSKSGEYVLSKNLIRELALSKYKHIKVIQIWGCFGRYEKESRFITDVMTRIKREEPIVIRENKLFSYIYVDDLVGIVKEFIDQFADIPDITKAVGYTETLYNYAQIVKEVTRSQQPIIVEKENFFKSYVGQDDSGYPIRNLGNAIGEYWNAFNNHTIKA